jgi:hypothetical protein
VGTASRLPPELSPEPALELVAPLPDEPLLPEESRAVACPDEGAPPRSRCSALAGRSGARARSELGELPPIHEPDEPDPDEDDPLEAEPDELDEDGADDSPPPRGWAEPVDSLPAGLLRWSAQTGLKLSVKAVAAAMVSF